MKKLMSQMYVLCLILLSLIIVSGCGEIFMHEVNKSPDDDISKAIYEAVERKKVHYHGKQSSNSGEIAWYEYTVHDYEDENVLTNMVEAVNAVMIEKETTEKICVVIREETMEGGGTEGVASLCNYYENGDEFEKYESLQSLYIYGTERSIMRKRGSPYDKVSTYINLPDIKRLTVSKKIAQSVEEEGIDWYEIWPDLEYYEVLDE
ncbi:MAG: hypothetical protein K2K56_13605 [Lachnospiraceae bacterium]|nr:hypothetical protein [Lachnospiraceae bacterium]